MTTDDSVDDAVASAAPSHDLAEIDSTAESESTTGTETAKESDSELLVEISQPQPQSKQATPLPEAVIEHGKQMDVEFLPTTK